MGGRALKNSCSTEKQKKRSWKFWTTRGSDWSPIEVLALCPCVSFGLRWQGQELCPIWWQINHKRFSWRLPSRIIFFSFLYDLNIFQNCYFSMSVTYLGTWNFCSQALGIQKAVHFRDSDLAHLRGWENLFPSLPSRKSTSEGAEKAICRFAVLPQESLSFLAISVDTNWF